MTFKALTLGALAAVHALAATAPAMAQDRRWSGGDYDGHRTQPASYGGGGELRNREDRISGWIDGLSTQGRLSLWRARRAYGALEDIRRDGHDLWERQGGLAPGQTAWLNRRLDRLARSLRENGDEGRGWSRW